MTAIPVRIAAPLLLSLSLAACASGRGGSADSYVGLTPTEQFAIEVRQRPEEIRLAPHPGGLSQAQESAVAELADRWRAAGGGVITIQAPAGGDQGSARATSESARAMLVTMGASPDDIRLVSYNAPADAPRAVIIGYMAFEASGQQCGREWENLAADHMNTPFKNFGCSVTANVATQIANPRDLVTPRTMTPADATRRSVVLDKYRKGEVTSTVKDDQATGTLSTVAGNQ
jgi:pilus assembly protein CpaD